MKPRLYLLTHSFPFANSETFLESEAPILANKFDITFVPSVIEGDARSIPTSASVDDRLAARFSQANRKLKSLFSPRCWSALISDAAKHRFKLSGIRRENSFIADALAAEQWCRATLGSDPAIVYTYWLTGKTQGLIWAKETNQELTVVSRTHRFDLYDDRYDPAFWPLRQKTLDGIDRLFVISDDGVNFLNKNYHLKDNVCISRLGAVDPKILTQRSGDGILRIVSVSSFLPQKRVRMIAQSIVRFATENPSQSVLWNHFGDGTLKAEVDGLLDSESPSNLSYNLAGSVPNHAIQDHYRNQPVDLFINLSDSEGIPVSIMEAQACGIVVVATDVGGVSEIVNNENGFLVHEDVEYSQLSEIFERTAGQVSVPKQQEIVNFFQQNYNAETNYRNFATNLKAMSNDAV